MKRLLRTLLGVILVVVLIFVAPLIGVALSCRPWERVDPAQSDLGSKTAAPAAVQSVLANLPDYQRLEDQSYLTLPEWYIVYSADEYATLIAEKPPSRFPYLAAIGQYWRSYDSVCRETRGRYPFNRGYHLSLAVIGGSFTLENLLRGVYENSLGRVSELLSSGVPTEEELYAAKVAADYGQFIHTVPFYEFPFGDRLRGLWRETSLGGPNPVRKWERKVALTIEYGGKALYTKLIRAGTQSTYAPEKLEVFAWVAAGADAALARQPEVRVVQSLGKDGALIAVPRYEAFTQLVPKLTADGVRFVQIAGNDEILVTATAPRSAPPRLAHGDFLFAMPVVIDPARQRIAVKVAVPELHLLLAELSDQGIRLEHLYDY